MLSQSFMSADDLGLTEPQRDALQKVLVLFETEKLVHYTGDDVIVGIPDHTQFSGHFNMGWWANNHPCGTVGCIGGTAEMIGGVRFKIGDNDRLANLFYPAGDDECFPEYGTVTPAQAARALRSYLTTGDAKWAEAVA